MTSNADTNIPIDIIMLIKLEISIFFFSSSKCLMPVKNMKIVIIGATIFIVSVKSDKLIVIIQPQKDSCYSKMVSNINYFIFPIHNSLPEHAFWN